MMELSLKATVLGGKNKIPVAARASVVAPVRDGGVVPQNRTTSHVGLVLITEIFHPGIDFLLARGVRGHFAAEGVGLSLPAASARAHLRFEILSLSGQSVALEFSKE